MTDPERSVDPDSMEIAPGTHVGGKYTVLAPLGGGAMGTVYVAKHIVTGGRVALKVLRNDGPRGAAHLERFEREAAIAAQVGHPGIVKVLDAGLDQRTHRLWLAMELLDGETLADRMRRTEVTRLSLLRSTRGFLDALAAAHDAGFVHRDLKPENVFVTAPSSEGPSRVVLLDFGIARPVGVKTATQTGIAVGTPAYMSPEQALRPSSIGVRADVWSVGAMLYEIVAGAPPFDGESPHAIVLAATAEPHVPLDRVCPWVPPALARLVDRCLAKSADARPDARELGAILDRILSDPESAAVLERGAARSGGGGGGAPTESGEIALLEVRIDRNSHVDDLPPADLPPRRRAPGAVVAVSAALLVIIAVGAALLGRSAAVSTPSVATVPPLEPPGAPEPSTIEPRVESLAARTEEPIPEGEDATPIDQPELAPPTVAPELSGRTRIRPRTLERVATELTAPPEPAPPEATATDVEPEPPPAPPTTTVAAEAPTEPATSPTTAPPATTTTAPPPRTTTRTATREPGSREPPATRTGAQPATPTPPFSF